MNVKLKPNAPASTSTEGKQPQNFSELAFFVAINIVVVPLSAYQTYLGYQVDVASNILVAFAIAAFSAILFAAMNFGIRQRRLNGEAHAMQVLMYIVPLAISFAGNFNAFYTEQMKKSLYENEVAEYEKKLETTKNTATVSLQAYSGVAEFEKKYEELYQSLQTEATLLDGFGVQCGKIYDTLWKLSGSPSYSKHPLDYPKDKRLAMANQLLAPMKDKKVEQLNQQIKPKLVLIDSLYKEMEQKVDKSKKENTLHEEGAVLIDQMRKLNNKIGSETKSIVVDFDYNELDVSAKNEIGTVKYAFTSGFIDMPSPSATAFSLFLSLILDLAPLLYILFFVKSGKQKNKGRISTGPRSI